MIKHILSKYSEKDTPIRKKADKDVLVKTIYERSIIKKDIPDEFLEIGNTLETRTKEDSDPDEFIIAGPTKSTFTKEDSDPDEFLLNDMEISSDGDFDEILLI